MKLNVMKTSDTVLYTSTITTTDFATGASTANFEFMDSAVTNAAGVAIVSADVNKAGSFVAYATYSLAGDVLGLSGGYIYLTIPDNNNMVSLQTDSTGTPLS